MSLVMASGAAILAGLVGVASRQLRPAPLTARTRPKPSSLQPDPWTGTRRESRLSPRELRLDAEAERTELLLRIVEAGASHAPVPAALLAEIHEALSARLEKVHACIVRPYACDHQHHAVAVDRGAAAEKTPAHLRHAAMARLEAVVQLIVATRDRAGHGLEPEALDDLQDHYEDRLEALIDADLRDQRIKAHFGSMRAFEQLRRPDLVATRE